MAEQPSQHASTEPKRQAGEQQIDIKLLAEKVYRLMLADIRLTKSRGGSARRRGRE